MDDILEHRLIRILRDSPLPSVAVGELHSMLVAETGPSIASTERLMDELRQHSDVFFVLEAETPLGDPGHWPLDVRAQYEKQLEAAGIVAGPRVALAPRRSPAAAFVREAGPRDDAVGGQPPDPLHDSLVEIWEVSAHRPALRRVIAAALLQITPRDRGMEPERPDG
jgi:ribosomal protein S18 acetylase RimI-like enzyme